MFPPSLPACLKRKSSSSTPPTSNKRARLVGTFEPRLIIPTGARRSWTFAKSPRFILDPVTQGAKRTLVGEEEITPSPSNCKVRLLDNRDALFLPGQKRLATKKPQRRRTSISSPSKKSLEFVRLRRRDQFKRQLQRADSGICMESDEDLDLDTMHDTVSSLESGEDIKLFDVSTFTGFGFEMMETTETTTEDNMEIEDASISTTTTTAASSEGDADSDSTSTEQATSSSRSDIKKEELEKDMSVEEKEEKEEDRDSGIDVEIEDAEKKTPEQKEVSNKPSTKDTAVKERIQKRLGGDELIKLGPPSPKRGVAKKQEEEADDEEEEPPRRPTRRRSVKPSLPTTVEEEEEEGEVKEKGREGDDTVIVVKRRSSRVKAKEEEEKDEEESEKETEKEEKKEEKKEKKKQIRRKVKAEEPESEASEDEREDEKKLQKKVKEEAMIEVEEKEPEEDKMEEDTDESLNGIVEDTDMSTDEDIVDFIPETEEKTQVEDLVIDDPIEEDVTMSEDDEMAEEETGDISEEQLQKEAKEEIEAGKASKDTGEVKDIETTDAADEEKGGNGFQTIEVKKTVRHLVLPSTKEEFEISKILSVPKTPRTPRSPNMSRFNIALSKAPRKLEPFLSPRRKKFSKPEDLTPHWTMKRLAAKKGQQPFNPANISRHAYRDPANDEDLLTTRKSFWDDDDVEEPYVDDQYVRVDWPLKSWGGTWMAENGGALIEFCVRKLEGFNMAW